MLTIRGNKRRNSDLRFKSLVACFALSLTFASQVKAASVGTYTSPSTTDSGYIHAAAGFQATIPFGWSLQVTSTGLELNKDNALLTIDYLQIEQGENSEVLALMVGSKQADVDNFSSPYPGLRTSLKEQDYVAEVAVLKTPVGFYVVSLEQIGKADPARVQTFEQLLASFQLLGTPPFDGNLPGMQFIDLGPVEVAIPPGVVTMQTGYMLWKSTAGGILTAEIVRHGTASSLTPLFEEWEKEMLGAETGLTNRSSLIDLRIDGRHSMRANYTGDDTRAGVIATEVAPGKILLVSLVAKQASFASHQPLLDAVSFSAADPRGEELHVAEDDGFDTSATFSSLASNPDSSYDLNKSDQKRYNQLRSNDPEKVRQAAKYLYKGRYQNKSLLDTAAYVLESGYKKQPSNTHVDAMAWICKALGQSGNKKYQSLLKNVANGAPSRKLKGYADKAARQLY